MGDFSCPNPQAAKHGASPGLTIAGLPPIMDIDGNRKDHGTEGPGSRLSHRLWR